MLRSDTNWQQKLLPFMQGTIILVTLYYLVISVYQFNSLSQKTKLQSSNHLDKFLGTYTINSTLNDSLTKVDKDWIARCIFESYAIETRQQNAEYLMISRTWIKYLGFITGMILCIVGAVFILGKLSDKTSSTVGAENGNSKFTLQSNSPGLIMAGFGTLLILSTIFTHQYIEKTDAAVYFHPQPFSSQETIRNLYKQLSDSTMNQEITDSTNKRPPGL